MAWADGDLDVVALLQHGPHGGDCSKYGGGSSVLCLGWNRTAKTQLRVSENIPFGHEWLLVVDADEEPSATFREEITAMIIQGKEPYVAYLIPYQYYFLGKLLKRGRSTT